MEQGSTWKQNGDHGVVVAVWSTPFWINMDHHHHQIFKESGIFVIFSNLVFFVLRCNWNKTGRSKIDQGSARTVQWREKTRFSSMLNDSLYVLLVTSYLEIAEQNRKEVEEKG